MIAQILFTVALAGALVYVHAQSKLLGLIRVCMYSVIIAGIFFVWSPDQSTRLANLLGIGRGADLVYYIWIIISLAVFVNIHLKLRENVTLVTQLARQIAITEAQRTARTEESKDSPKAATASAE